MLKIHLIAFFLLVNLYPIIKSCSYYATNGGLCPTYCSYCDNMTQCYSCCTGYYLSSPTTCTPCSDINCMYCDSISYVEYCYQCYSSYGIKASNTRQCIFCNINTATNCMAANNCSVNGNCADCPTYALSSSIKCVTCNQLYRNCQQCDNTQCTTCNSNYYMNSTANYTQCVSCNITNCQYCSTGPRCFTCNLGYYPHPVTGICVNNPSNCVDAYFSTFYGRIYCYECQTVTQLYMRSSSGGICKRCNMFVGLAYCQTCTQANQFSTVYTCHTCINGSYLSGTRCYPCSLPCTTCITSSSNCLSCVNGSYYLNAGNCYLCNVGLSYCLTCINSTFCTSCQTSYFLHYNPTACVTCSSVYPNCIQCDTQQCLICSPGYTLSATGSCQIGFCNSPCLACDINPDSCHSCIDGYYHNNATLTCLLCDTTCLQCSAFSVCTKCDPDLLLSSNTCVSCPLHQYHNLYTMTCQICPNHCLTCKLSLGCLTCQPLFQLKPVAGRNLCADICGDGYGFQLPCDTIQKIQNDGCTDTCEIEPNYICSNIFTSVTINGTVISTNQSSCSYVGTIAVQVVKASQSLFDNTLSLTFSIVPYLYGFPTNSDSQILLSSVFQLSPFCAMSNCIISVDPITQTVSFEIDHSADISASNFALNINFAVLSSLMFQYLASSTYVFSLTNLQSFNILGVYYTSEELYFSKLIYYWSVAICIFSLLFLLIGAFSKQLAGLEQIILCQSVYILLLFHEGALSLGLRALSGFHFSFGWQFESDRNRLLNHPSYQLGMDITSFNNNFMVNLIIYFIPIIFALFFLAYKLKYKHLAVKKDFGQQSSQVLMGQTLFYIVLFNLYGFISFSYLYFNFSYDNHHYWSSLSIAIAFTTTIFALYNYNFRPAIMGIFRNSFRLNSQYREIIKNQSKCMLKFKSFMSFRPYGSSKLQFYQKLCANYYYIYLIYLFSFMTLNIMQLSFSKYIIAGLQCVVLLFLIIIKPYFNLLQKIRSMFTFILLFLANFINFEMGHQFKIPIIFLGLFTLHALLTAYILIISLIDQMRRKCNDRTKIVKHLFKEDNQQCERNQKEVLKELIERYQLIGDKQINVCRINTIQQKMIEEQNQNQQQRQQNDKNKAKDAFLAQMQEQIIVQQHEHFRFQKGMQFFVKYGNKIQNQLIDNNYDNI